MEFSEEEKKAVEYLTKYIHWETYGERSLETDIKTVLKLVEKQQKEIEEKTTILLAGAEKVKQLEKGNRSLMESRIKWKNRYYKEKAKNKEFISKDKIREKIKNIEDIYKKEMKPYQTEYGLNVSLLSKKEKEELINKRNGLLTQKITLEELLEEK